jgi:hypothetical protein
MVIEILECSRPFEVPLTLNDLSAIEFIIHGSSPYREVTDEGDQPHLTRKELHHFRYDMPPR